MSENNKAGRPGKLTPEVQKLIVNSLKAGGLIDIACQIAGVDRSTFHGWIRRANKEKSGLYVEFAAEIRKALASAELRLVGQIATAAATQWQAAAWLLERRFPQRWGRSKLYEGQSLGDRLKSPPVVTTKQAA